MNLTAEEALAELSPVMLIPRLQAIQHSRLLDEDYRKRLFDGHEMQLAAMGFKPTPMTKDEEMGDINVANHFYGQSTTASQLNNEPKTAIVAAEPKRKVTKEEIDVYIKRKIREGIAKPPQESWLKKWLPTIIGGAIGLGGLGGSVLINKPSTPPAAVDTDTDTNTQYKFDISSENGKGFSTE